MKPMDVVWGLVFILIGVVGGVVIGGIANKHTGMLIAGLCFAGIGVLIFIARATAKPRPGPGKEFHVFATFTRLPVWAWIVLVALLVIAFASMALLK